MPNAKKADAFSNLLYGILILKKKKNF